MLNHYFFPLIFNLIIINLLTNSYQNSECNLDPDSICGACNDNDGNYSICKYEDLYCSLLKQKNIYSKCKYLFQRDLRKIKYNNIMCNAKGINFTAKTHIQTMLNIKNITNRYNDENIRDFHCDYDFKITNLNESSTNKLNITILLGNKNVNDDFNFFFYLLKNNIFNPENLITKEKLISNKKTVILEYFQNVSVYIDVNVPEGFVPNLSMKIEYYNIENEEEGEGEGEDIELEKEDMYPLYLTLYIAIPLLIMLVALIIYLCCKKQDTGILGGEIRVIGFANNENENAYENEDNNTKAYRLNENKKKLIALFKTILAAREYTKNHNKIDCPRCTICYEDFEVYSSIVSVTPCQHIFHYKCLNNWLNQNILNPKCPNCNFDLMTVDINKLKKPQNQILTKLKVKREGSINENLLNNKESKKKNVNDSNNNTNHGRRRNNFISSTNNNNQRTITISRISLNYSSNGNNNKKKKNDEENSNKNKNNKNSEEDEKEDENNIYNSHNCLNTEDEKENKNINNINNINNIYRKKKNNENISNNNSDIKEENNENSDKKNINNENENNDNDNDNESDNKSKLNNANTISSINVSESKSISNSNCNSNNNTTNQNKEYKTLSQEIMNSTRRAIN